MRWGRDPDCLRTLLRKLERETPARRKDLQRGGGSHGGLAQFPTVLSLLIFRSEPVFSPPNPLSLVKSSHPSFRIDPFPGN